VAWFKVDDSLSDHPKMVRLQAMKGWQSALALWTLAGAWVSRHLTDGNVPEAIVVRLGCTKRDAEMLVKCGFWRPIDGGYTFHDWTARNPARTVVEAKREKTRIRVADWRRNAVTDDVTGHAGNGSGNASGNASPIPSHPIPSGDLLTSFAISPGARGFSEPSAGQIRTRFQALFEARFNAAPYMGGGEVVSSFPDRLRDTAQRKGVDALELLEQTFAAWAQKPLDELAQNAPYAAFAARLGSLCKPNGTNGASELDELHAAQNAALAARDMARYESLVAEERRRRPKEPKS
jgi:hypothetical protein